jgi:hypothetical protein
VSQIPDIEPRGCPHECDCTCHDGGGKHAMKCFCDPCQLCGRNIRGMLKEAHRTECHQLV